MSVLSRSFDVLRRAWDRPILIEAERLPTNGTSMGLIRRNLRSLPQIVAHNSTRVSFLSRFWAFVDSPFCSTYTSFANVGRVPA